MFLVDLRKLNITGKDAEKVLEKVNITVNKNAIPYDPEKPMIASGIRIGTPAVTTRGLKEKDIEQVGGCIIRAFKNQTNEVELKKIHEEVIGICKKFPLY